MRLKIPQIVARGALCALVSASLVCLPSCKDTDALKEIVYDQQSEIVDYDNPNKFLINDPTADVQSEFVSAIDKADSSRMTEEVQNVVVYSSNPNTEGYTAKGSVFDFYPDYTGIEASKGVRFVTDEQETLTPPEPQQTEEEPEETESIIAKVVQRETDEASKQPDKESAGQQEDSGSENPDPDPGEGGGSSAIEDPEGGGSDGEVQIAEDLTSAFTDPPEVNSIAAYGEYAVIVQMLGGKGALAAADKQTLESGFSTVFAAHGASEVAVGWADGGKTAANMDVDAIIDSGAQTILVPSSDYGKAGNGLTNEDVKKLNDAGVSMTVIYELTNSTYIKDTVKAVGKMLAGAEGIEFDAMAKAEAYVAFHDRLVDACVSANGGLAGSMTYELKNDKGYSNNTAANYTLLIDEYDTSARFTKSIGDVSLTTNGVGIATFNYVQTPVSYYIQAGGLVNTGAAKTTKSQTGKIAVWQFNTNIRGFKKAYWTYDADGPLAASEDVSSGSSAGWDYVLTSCSSERNGLSISGDVSVVGLGASFGSDSFPRIIAGTQQVKEKMIENSKSITGLYHAYDIPEGKYNPATYGLAYSNTGILYSSIGIDGMNGLVADFKEGVIPDESICVTPHGLFDSWLDGTLESCLEAAWVTDVVNGAQSVGYKDYVKDFYSTIYGYTLSDAELAQIVAGIAK